MKNNQVHVIEVSEAQSSLKPIKDDDVVNSDALEEKHNERADQQSEITNQRQGKTHGMSGIYISSRATC